MYVLSGMGIYARQVIPFYNCIVYIFTIKIIQHHTHHRYLVQTVTNVGRVVQAETDGNTWIHTGEPDVSGIIQSRFWNDG